MRAGPMKLLRLLGEDKRTFNIPVYQRNYEWNKKQILEFFYDVEKIIDKDFSIGHFLGTIVFVSTEKEMLIIEHVIIDGQQRITTTVLLLKAIHDLLEDDNRLKEEIYNKFFINQYVDEKHKLKLKPVEEDMKAFMRLLEDKNVQFSKIHENYRLFIKLLKKSKHRPEDFYKALTKVEIVYISLDKDAPGENPQLIFESLNSTGLSLTSADLIRNFVLMGLDYESQSDLYEKYWIEIEKYLPNARISDYVRDYLTMKTGVTPNKDKVYESFKAYFNQNKIDSEYILRDLVRYAKYYHWFININCPDKKINMYLNELNILKVTVPYPYLLKVFDDYFSKEIIEQEEISYILQIIVSYLYRRNICSIPTNALNRIFAVMAREVDKKLEEGLNYVEATEDYLMSRKGNGIFPRNLEFKTNFMETDFYNRKSKIALYTLYTIEQSIHKEVVQYKDLTIEHILPQKITPIWSIELGRNATEVHKLYKDTIGNLTLTKYNSEMTNKSFSDKKHYYKNSNIKITRDITNYQLWNQEAIEQRAEELYDLAKDLWIIPEDKYKNMLSKELITGIEYSIQEDIDVTGYKPMELIIDNEGYKISSWKEMLIEFNLYILDLDDNLYYSILKNSNYSRLFLKEEETGRSVEIINKDIRLETGFGSKDIINFIRILAEEFSIEDLVGFKVRR